MSPVLPQNNPIPLNNPDLIKEAVVVNGHTASMNVTWKGRKLTVAITFSQDIDNAKATSALNKSLDKMILLADTYKLGTPDSKTAKISVKSDGSMTRERKAGSTKPITKNYGDINAQLDEKLNLARARLSSNTFKPNETLASLQSKINVIAKLCEIFKKIKEERTISENNTSPSLSPAPRAPQPNPTPPLPQERNLGRKPPANPSASSAPAAPSPPHAAPSQNPQQRPLQPPAPQPQAPQPQVPQPQVPQPPAPQTPAPQTPAPQPPASQPPASQPQVPQTPAPQTPAPQPQVPQTPAPQTPAPQPPAPQPQVPQSPAPQTPAPQPQVPQTPAPQTPAPQPQVPQSPAPQTPAPQPQVPQSPAPQPQVPQPPSQSQSSISQNTAQ